MAPGEKSRQGDHSSDSGLTRPWLCKRSAFDTMNSVGCYWVAAPWWQGTVQYEAAPGAGLSSGGVQCAGEATGEPRSLHAGREVQCTAQAIETTPEPMFARFGGAQPVTRPGYIQYDVARLVSSSASCCTWLHHSPVHPVREGHLRRTISWMWESD